MTNKTIHNIGFLYCCGHRAQVSGAPTKLHVELRVRGLAPEIPDMDRPIDTICSLCWMIKTDGKVLVLRSQVLRTVLDKEQSHSLLVLLYHLADRIIADKTRGAHLNILAHWAARVAHEYPKEHIDTFFDAIRSRPVGATIHRLVVDDALLSIQTLLSPSNKPLNCIPETCLSNYDRAVARFDHRARLIRWSVWSPWPAVVGPLLTDIARAGVLFAAMFKANTQIRPADWDEDPSRFPPRDSKVHVDHERLAETVHKFKVECYSLFHDATRHPMAATRNELRAVIKCVRFLDAILERMKRLDDATMYHYEAWCNHQVRGERADQTRRALSYLLSFVPGLIFLESRVLNTKGMDSPQREHRILNDVNATKYVSSCTSFPHFSQLPIELRLKIWKFCFPSNRFISILIARPTSRSKRQDNEEKKQEHQLFTSRNHLGNLISGDPYHLTVSGFRPWAASLPSVCREARQAFLAFYRVSMPLTPEEPGLLLA
ncbi:hypothetical protein PG997_010944 [Apiospora hydei]|uniref:2EXR domain-containing protein n=1 Tax=Apiospora hydei TaxID=1337664 RepID=A0ABR1VHM7_9PEZI